VTDAGGSLIYQSDFTYDARGNRLESLTVRPGEPDGVLAISFDARDRVQEVDGVAWRWDTNGNLVDDGELHYTWPI
jgi:hypothetical protein